VCGDVSSSASTLSVGWFADKNVVHFCERRQCLTVHARIVRVFFKLIFFYWNGRYWDLRFSLWEKRYKLI